MPLLAAFFLAYFGFHLMNGERGVFAYFHQTHQHKLLEQELEKVRVDRKQMQLQVSGLRPQSLDLDLLDQQARAMLGLVAEDEKVILLNAD